MLTSRYSPLCNQCPLSFTILEQQILCFVGSLPAASNKRKTLEQFLVRYLQITLGRAPLRQFLTSKVMQAQIGAPIVKARKAEIDRYSPVYRNEALCGAAVGATLMAGACLPENRYTEESFLNTCSRLILLGCQR